MAFNINHAITLKDLEEHPILSLANKSRYSCYQLVFPENVAEHTCNVSMIAVVLSQYFNRLEGKEIVDIRDAVYRGVMHDVGEAYTADVTLNIKQSSPTLRTLISEYENRIMSEDKLLDDVIRADINNAKDVSTMGGVIITLADRIDAMLKIDREHNIQNSRVINELYQETILSFLKSIHEVLASGTISTYKKVVQYLMKLLGEMLVSINDEYESYVISAQRENIKETVRLIINELTPIVQFDINKFKQRNLLVKLQII